jgi:S1-C subfamily serine protease
MPADPRHARLLARAGRALGDHQVRDAVARLRAIVGPASIPAGESLAQAAWDKLRNGDAPPADELAALELVIRLLRPAPLSRNGDLADLPDQQGHNLYPQDLKDEWAAFRPMVRPLLPSIGRVNLKDGTHIGTGFLVADGVLATNRHVLADLTFGTEVLAAGSAQVVFQREFGSNDDPANVVGITGVIDVASTVDIALLAVPKLGRPVAAIDVQPPAEGQRVVVIGYPARDAVRNPLFADAVFAGRYGVRRAAIGEMLDGTAAPHFYHDCSTLGGNSGSPVFSMQTGRVVGMHRSGFFMYRNEAIEGSALDRERVRVSRDG